MKNLLTRIVFMLALMLSQVSWAQIKLGENPTSLSPYALLEMESSTKGLIVPRMTAAQRDAAFDDDAPAGTLIFNTDSSELQYLRITVDPASKRQTKVWESATQGTPISTGAGMTSLPEQGDAGNFHFDETNNTLYVYNGQTNDWTPVGGNTYITEETVFLGNELVYTNTDGSTATVDLTQLGNGTAPSSNTDSQTLTISPIDVNNQVVFSLTNAPSQTLDLSDLVTNLGAAQTGPAGPAGPPGPAGPAGSVTSTLSVSALSAGNTVTIALAGVNTETLDLSALAGGGSGTDSQTLNASAISSANTMTLAISNGNTVTFDFNSIAIDRENFFVQNLTASKTFEVLSTSRLNSTTFIGELTANASSTLATTTLTAGLLDFDGDVGMPGQVLSSTGAGTDWVNVSGGLNSGTVTNSTLRWNGTDWVEATTLLSSLTGVSVSVSTTLATTTLTGVLQDYDGENGTAGQVLSSTGTSTNWVNVSGGLNSGTVTNSTLHWNGTDWVEATTLLSSPTGVSVSVSTTLATTTLTGVLQDYDGENGTAGQVLSSTGTSTNWVTVSGGLTSGTVTNSTLHWNGTDWVEATTLLSSPTGVSVSVSTTLATTTLTGVLQDYDGDNGTAGQVLSSTGTSTNWVTVSGGLTSGTVTNSTLHWNGTDWVEATTLLSSPTGVSVSVSTTLATTTLTGVLQDYDGDNGTAGQVLSSTGTSTNWVTFSGSLTSGTVTNSTLHWNGTNWVEATTLLSSPTGVSVSVSTTLATTTISANLTVENELQIGSGGAASPATGGTITTSGGYTIHTFTSNGTFTPNGNVNVEYLVVGGGGAGATGSGGGGGAGGFRTGSLVIANTPITVTVGAGGAGSTGATGGNGGDSVFDSITAVGGGGGGTNSTAGATGGSGGGTGAGTASGGAGTAGQGNAGGAGLNSGNFGAGGGGGAAGAGTSAPASGGGNGGDGQQSSISGTATFYAAGGGGGTFSGTAGTGGTGGGGAGNNSGAGTPGTTNTGSGGGGSGGNSTLLSAAGGSGIVIIRYQTALDKQFHVDSQGVQTLKDSSGDEGTTGQVLSSTGGGTNWVDTNRMVFRTVTGDTTLTASDSTIVLRATTAAAVTLTLPLASSLSAGTYFTFKRLDDGATPASVTIAPNVADSIDGAANQVLPADGDKMTVQTDGVNAWYIISD